MTTRLPPTNAFGPSAVDDGVKVTNADGWLTIAGFQQGYADFLSARKHHLWLTENKRTYTVTAFLYESDVIEPKVAVMMTQNLEAARRQFRKWGHAALAGENVGAGAHRLVWVRAEDLTSEDVLYLRNGNTIIPAPIVNITAPPPGGTQWSVLHQHPHYGNDTLRLNAGSRVRVSRFIPFDTTENHHA